MKTNIITSLAQQDAVTRELALVVSASRLVNDEHEARFHQLIRDGWRVTQYLPIDGNTESVTAILQFTERPNIVVVTH